MRTFVLSISPANLPSLRMAEAMNFLKVGEHLDEVDGLEWVMRAEIDEIPPPPCADLTRSAPG
ncbi:MAG: hypothetical protein VCA73_10115 [Roseibacillus sp.]